MSIILKKHKLYACLFFNSNSYLSNKFNFILLISCSGYMSPEYAMDGHFSVKSDVFSFGVLVLEIVSGKKNRGFYYSNNELNLLGHVSSTK